MLDGRVTASRPSCTAEAALGRPRPAGLRWLENSPAAVAANLFKDGLDTARAGSPVADLLTLVVSALQRPPAWADANVFGFEIVGDGGGLRSVLPPGGQPVDGLLFARAAVGAALMSSAVQLDLADPRAQGRSRVWSLAGGLVHGPATPAWDLRHLLAGWAGAGVAGLVTVMTAVHEFAANLLAMGDVVFAGLSWPVQKVVEWSLPTETMEHDIG